jgi:hypothetical protein
MCLVGKEFNVTNVQMTFMTFLEQNVGAIKYSQNLVVGDAGHALYWRSEHRWTRFSIT